MIPDSEQFVGLALTQLWQVTVVIIAVGMSARVFCRNRPHLAHVLWILVFVKCVTPPLWSSATGVFTWADSAAIVRTRDIARDVRSEGTVSAPSPVGRFAAADTGGVSEAPAITNSFVPPHESRWPTLFSAWLCGAATIASVFLIRRLRFARRLRRSIVDADAGLTVLVADLARELGIRRQVRLQLTSEPMGPATYGVIHPTLLLPQVLVNGKSADETRLILGHELIHVRRGDACWGWLQLLTLCLWWFHPLVWWANRRMCRERERCCDEEVVSSLALDPGQYSQCLIDVLKLKGRLRPAFALSGVRPIEITQRRLEHIMTRHDRFHRRTPRVHWIVLAVGLPAVLPGAGFPQTPPLGDESIQSAEGTLAARIQGTVQDQQRRDNGHVIVPAGTCDDGDGGVVSDAEIVLYRIDSSLRRQDVVARTRSDEMGRFRFAEVPGHPEELERYAITATAPGRASQVIRIPTPWRSSDELQISMPPAGVLRGRVLGLDGQRVVGAKVWVGGKLRAPVPGVMCAVTNDDGDYVIDDLTLAEKGAWARPEEVEIGETVYASMWKSPPRVYCRHPQFEYTWTGYESVPGEANFLLKRGGVIEGQVLYGATGEPAAGVAVEAQSIEGTHVTLAMTDEEGRYRLRSLRPEKYNIWSQVDGWTAPAIDSIQAASGETVNAPDLELVRGGVVKGRLVDAETGEPIFYEDYVEPIEAHARPYIAVRGPARPWSGPGQMGEKFREDGSYEIRIPPGENYVQFVSISPWQVVRPAASSDPPPGSTEHGRSFGPSIAVSVSDGETIEMDFAVSRRPE